MAVTAFSDPVADDSRPRAAIYTRVSHDPRGESESYRRQAEQCQVLAEQRDWLVTVVFIEDDTSAYAKNVRRPGFEQMCAMVRRGEVDVVIAWKLDRLLRRVRDCERIIELSEEADARFVTFSDGIDTGADLGGRIVTRVLAMLAELESETISLRLSNYQLSAAREGRGQFGGSHRPFGHVRGWAETVPEEAAQIRQAAQAVLAGRSLRSICTEWNDPAASERRMRQGLAPYLPPTSHTPENPSFWTQVKLRRLLLDARLAGQREHKGKLYGPTGKIAPILDLYTAKSLRLLLTNPARNLTREGKRSYLLSGLVVCGGCGQPMVGRPRQDKVRRYVCPRGPSYPKHCGKVAMLSEWVEDLVTADVLHFLGDERLSVTAVRAGNPAERQNRERLTDHLVGIEGRMNDIADAFAQGTVDRVRLERVMADLSSQREEALRELDRVTPNTVSAGLLHGTTLHEAWDRAKDVEARRDVLRLLLERVTIKPSERHGCNRMDSSRIDIDYRLKVPV